MVSKTLVKLIDQAILPAVVLAGAKVIGILFVNYKFNLEWQLGPSGLLYSSKEDFVLVNSYSSIFMFSVVFIGLLWVIIRASFLHSTHITPGLSSKLAERKLNFLVVNSFGVFSKAAVWLSYTWLTTAIVFVQRGYGLIFPWVFYITLAVSVVATIFLILDIEKDVVENENNLKRQENISVSISDISGIIKQNG